MADASLQSLLSTKAALDLGLVSQADFDAVKNAFLRAQQIKSALDVGLIKPEDYEETKQSFLGSLIGGGAAAVTAPAAAAAPPAAGAAARAPAEQAPAAPVAAPEPPAARPPPVAWTLPPPAPKVAAPAPAAPQPAAAPVATERRPAANLGVPSNIPKMGGIKAQAQGVRRGMGARAVQKSVGGRGCQLLPPPACSWRQTAWHLPRACQAHLRRCHILKCFFSSSAAMQTSMSGISVTEDAVNLFYLMRLKATVRRGQGGFVVGRDLPGLVAHTVARTTDAGRASPHHRPPPPPSLVCPSDLQPCAVQVGSVAGGRQRAVRDHCSGGRQGLQLGRLLGSPARRRLPLRR